LFLLMVAAVFPFGRVDLIGHATILAPLLVVLADPIREKALDLEVTPRDRRATFFVPLGIAAALAVTMVSYAGMHRLIYHWSGDRLAGLVRAESSRPAHRAASAPPGAFWRSSEHYHGGPEPASGAAPTAAMMAAMDRMHAEMNSARMTGDIDRDFTALMIPHHQSAVEMARVYLRSGRDPELRRLAQNVVASQEAEIREMRGGGAPAAGAAPSAHGGH
jgi:hypothetical protein